MLGRNIDGHAASPFDPEPVHKICGICKKPFKAGRSRPITAVTQAEI